MTLLRIVIFMAILGVIEWDAYASQNAPLANPRPHWEFAGWYGGGCYPNVEFDPNVKNRVYLVSDVAGIWRSDDLGERWHFINQGLDNFVVSFLHVAPSDSNILYAGTEAGLLRSKNAGSTWEQSDTVSGKISFKRPQSYRSYAVFHTDPATIAVGTVSGAVFFSQDYGDHWRVLGSNEQPLDDKKPITAMGLTPDDRFLFVASEAGLARYDLHENKWHFFENSPRNITDFLIQNHHPKTLYVAGNKTLFLSTDGGQTWTESMPIPEGKIYRIALMDSHEEDRPRIAVSWNKGWRGGILVSDDVGESWKRYHKKDFPDTEDNPTRHWSPTNSRIAALKINPFDSNVLFRTDWWGVWRSDDQGIYWHEKIKGAPNSVGSDIFITDEGHVYVATMDNGLLKSTDGGKTYEPLFPKEDYRKDRNGHVWRVAVTEGEPKRIIATSSPWNDDINQVIISQDGKDFITVRSGLPSRKPRKNTVWRRGYPKALAVDPTRPHIVYLGIDGDDGGGLYVSRDAGWHWTQTRGQPASKRIYNALAVDPTNPRRIFLGTKSDEAGGVYRSEDEGNSWHLVFDDMKSIFDMAITEDGVIYAGGGKGQPSLYASWDSGATWELMKQFEAGSSVEAITVDPNDPRRIAISTVSWGRQGGGRINLSTDRGRTWQDLTGNLPNGQGAAAMAFHPHEEYLYMVRYAGSVYKTDLSFR